MLFRLAATLASCVISGAAASPVVPVPAYVNGWYSAGRAEPTDSVTVIVTVKPQNLDRLAEIATAVSTPGSAQYKEYLTMEEVNALTAPSAADMAVVTEWASAAADHVAINAEQGIVTATFSVAAAESVFSTEFRKVTHSITEQRVIRAGDYTVPDDVAAATKAIFGLHGLPIARATHHSADTTHHALGSAPGTPPPVTPAVISTKYSIPKVKVTGSQKARTAVAEFQGQLMEKTDLVAFFKQFVPSAPASDAVVNKFVGTSAVGQGIEAQLDIQYIMGVAPGVKTDFYEQMNQDFCADLKNWTSILLADSDAPLVHSVSYGWQGNLTQIGCKGDEIADVDTGFQKLAAAGITIIFASGDSGSGYAPPEPPQPAQCSHTSPGTKGVAFTGDILRNLTIGIPPNDPTEGAWICCEIAGEVGAQEGYKGFAFYGPEKCPADPHKECVGHCVILKTIAGQKPVKGATSGKAGKIPPQPKPKLAPLWPSWPASSPWVTAVGATRFHEDKVSNPEAAVSEEDHFGSGGGFSPWKALAQPAYQKDAVAAYVALPGILPDPTKASYDITGRATPDVSALGTAFQVVNGGKPLPGGVGGTSASAPTFAAIIGLINDQLVAKGKKPMGFLNPFIYKNAQAFTDVTIGSNKVGRGGPLLPYGWNCSKGWDPVTGMGTPVYTELFKAAMQ